MKIATAVALFFMTVSSALWAGESSVQIRVKGMACPFCVYGIEKKLKQVEGVSDVKSDFKQSLITVQPEPDSRPDVKALEQAVKEAGFSVDSITVGETP